MIKRRRNNRRKMTRDESGVRGARDGKFFQPFGGRLRAEQVEEAAPVNRANERIRETARGA